MVKDKHRPSLVKLTEIFLYFQFVKRDELMLDKSTGLINPRKARCSIYRYRWRTHKIEREKRMRRHLNRLSNLYPGGITT